MIPQCYFLISFFILLGCPGSISAFRRRYEEPKADSGDEERTHSSTRKEDHGARKAGEVSFAASSDCL